MFPLASAGQLLTANEYRLLGLHYVQVSYSFTRWTKLYNRLDSCHCFRLNAEHSHLHLPYKQSKGHKQNEDFFEEHGMLFPCVTKTNGLEQDCLRA